MTSSPDNRTGSGDNACPVERSGQAFAPDGVDLTLIRWMLSLSPGERLAALQGAVRSILRLRHARSAS